MHLCHCKGKSHCGGVKLKQIKKAIKHKYKLVKKRIRKHRRVTKYS